ncbi:MAG: Ig-like domain-containing protein [Bacteroidales bacterium]|nr:Ig-like domain-containing protein [Bacteroidales bacterium]
MKNRSLLWALAALVLASCVNDAANIEKINLKDEHVLTASLENPGSTRTSVEAGGTKVLWGVKENISVFLGTTNYKFTSLNTSPAASANFEGTPSLSGVSESNPINALSPYKAEAKISGGVIYYNLPASQQAVENSYNPNAHALVAYSPTTDISFYNVTGGIRFTLKQSGITDITLRGNNSETLAGDLQVKASGATPIIQNVTSAVKEIKLLPPTGGFKTGVWYYITTIPVKLSKGFTIDFKAGKLAATFTTSQSVTVPRGGYGSISEIDKNLTFTDPTVHVTSVTVDPTTWKMLPGETKQLTATVLPENATDKSIKWSSNKTDVATVDQNGVVTAVATGTAVIVALSNDGYKTGTCSVTVNPLFSEFKTQFAEGTGFSTLGNVIHYKYGTKYGSNANEFYVFPWSGNNDILVDSDASHFTCTSSKSGNVSVSVVKVGEGCAFLVKPLNNPTQTSESWSELTFNYKDSKGKTTTKTTRLVLFPSAATSAFSYSWYTLYNHDGSNTRPDFNTGSSFTHTMTKASDESYLRVFVSSDASNKFSVADTKDIATYEFTTSNSSIVKKTDKSGINGSSDKIPFVEYSFLTIGTSNIGLKYIDYKGNKLEKTIKVTVNKSFLASDDYIDPSTTKSNNSSSNRYFLPVSSGLGLYIRKASGTAYGVDDITGVTWTTSNSSYATITTNSSQGNRYIMVSGKAPGDVTITATGADGSKKYFYITVYKPVTGITPNSTTYKIGLGTAHTMNYTGEDYTVVPADATYSSSSYFKWKSLNTNVVSMTSDVITGVGVGTTTVQAAPKPKYDTYYDARKIQVVDYRLKVTNGNSRTAPINKLYANSDIITVEVGSEAVVCYASTGGSTYTWDGTCAFKTGTTNTSIVTATGGTKQYATIKGVSAGTAYIDLDYTGSNGRILQRYQVKVVPKFTWASGDIASNSSTARTYSSPFYLKVGGTVVVKAYHGSSEYGSSVAEAITWSSANTSLATVSPLNGSQTTVTGKGNGYVEIIGTDSNGNTRSFWAYVNTPVTSITMKDPYVVGKNYNTTRKFVAGTDFTVNPSNANPLKFNWKSTNTSIATVDENGNVSVLAGGAGSATIQVQPFPNLANLAYQNARTVKVVYWRMYAPYSNCTSSGSVQASDGTVSGGTQGFTSGSTLIIDKGKQVNLKFYNVSDGHKVGDGAYTFTNSNSSVVSVTSTNISTDNGSYITVKGLKAGTVDMSLTLNTVNSYFTMSFKVKVVE